MGMARRTPRPWPSHFRIAIGEPRPNYWSLAEAKSLQSYCGRSGRLFQDDKRTWKGRGKAQSMVIPCILSRTCHRGKNTIGPEVDQAKGVFTRSEPEHWSFLQHMWPKATWERFIGQPWVLKL